MRRRNFIALVGGVAALPLVARAQQWKPVVGFLAAAAPEGYAIDVAALRKGLSDTGYVDGQNLSIEYRWAQNQNARLPELATDLVRRGAAVIVTRGTPSALAAKAATTTIPILFFVGTDPVELGLVASFNRAGRQCHWHQRHGRGTRRQAAGTPARALTKSDALCRPRQSE